MYDHIKQVENCIGRKVTVLRAKKTFDYLLGEYILKKGKRKGRAGYSWPDIRNRWCTGFLKRDVFNLHFSSAKDLVQYHGIAHDEPGRIGKNGTNIIYPLYDWGITEKQALQYCYSHGFRWGEGAVKYSTGYHVGAARYSHSGDSKTYIIISRTVGRTG